MSKIEPESEQAIEVTSAGWWCFSLPALGHLDDRKPCRRISYQVEH